MSRSQRRQTPPFDTCPLVNPLEFVGSSFGSGMQESIAGERHSAVSHDSGELSQEVMLLLGVILAPTDRFRWLRASCTSFSISQDIGAT